MSQTRLGHMEPFIALLVVIAISGTASTIIVLAYIERRRLAKRPLDAVVNDDGSVTFRVKQLDDAKVDGAMYWAPDNVEGVKQLKREGRLDEAEALLRKLIGATEGEDEKLRWGVAPWYYEQLAIVLRKQQKYDEEIEVLERFARQRHAPGASVPKLLERLEKAKAKRKNRRKP